MNIALWLAAGVIVGWFAFTYLDKNGARGPILAAIIGALGGFAGGSWLTPMFGHVVIDAAAFQPVALVIAAVTAMLFVAVSDGVYERYGV